MTTTVRVPSARPFRVVEHVEDRREWNQLVQSFPAYDLKQGFEWGELRGEAGWTPHRLAVFDGMDCTAATTVLARAVPTLGALLYAPRGPLFHPSRPDALARLIAAVHRLAAEQRAILLRVSPGVSGNDAAALSALAAQGFVPLRDEFTTWNTPRCTQSLDLAASEDILWRGVRRRLREYMTAAARKGLVIDDVASDAELPVFYQLLVNTARLKGYPIRGLPYYRSLVQRYRSIGALTLLLARFRGGVLGGLLAVRLGRRSFLLYTSVRSEDETLKHHVSPALFWEYIRRAKADGCERADFGPSGVHLTPRETDSGYGVYRFKTAFGCRVETFAPFHDLVFRPTRYRAFRLCERFVLPRV